MPHPTATTRTRLQELGLTLRSALSAVLERVTDSPASVRPITLARSLRIDDSLSARLLRSIRAGDPLSSLRELPNPQGIRLFLAAAAKAGLPASARQKAEDAVVEFEQLLRELPLGRASLDTAIDGWLPSGRARAERAASQAIFKGMSQTLGYTVDAVCNALVIQPSADSGMCDSISFLAMHGIRRLREGSPILLFGSTQNPDPSTGTIPKDTPPQRTETLDGEHEVTDARKFLIRDADTDADLPIRLIERGTHTRFVLDAAWPPLNTPVTAAIASITRNAYRRYRRYGEPTESCIFASKLPVRTFIHDLFLHEDVYPSFVPSIVPRIDYFSHDNASRDEELLEVDRLDLDIDQSRLGWGLGRIGVKEWAGYNPALRRVFARAGWDPSRFRAFRCHIRYPLPFVSLTTWFDLPPGSA